MTSPRPRHRKRLTGVVASAGKMARTITVEVEHFPWHVKLKKQYRQSKRFLVDDPKAEASVGDRVLIEETKPLSRRKHFRLVRIAERAPVPAGGPTTEHERAEP